MEWKACFQEEWKSENPSRMQATNVSISPRAHGVACAARRPGTLLRLWYCVAPDRIFVHLAMSEMNDQREGTAWFEKVTDGDYGKPTASAK